MKTNFTKLLLFLVSPMLYTNLFAQDTTFIFDASEVTPDDSGYYAYGIPADVDENGTIDEGEWASKCMDFYEDYANFSNNDESGVYNGFSYTGGMVMPDCEPKYNTDPPAIPDGYVQLRVSATLDSAIGAIISPEIVNLVSISMDLSSDVSVRSDRVVAFFLEYTTDDGTTWEADMLDDDLYSLTEQAGAAHAFYDSATSEELRPMIAASKAGPIKLRLMVPTYALGGRLLDVHKIEITATKPVVSSRDLLANNQTRMFEIRDNLIIAKSAEIIVFNILGQRIGSGKMVAVERGIYIVKAPDGFVQKVYVR
ncbi:MAG: hypothetical protein JXB49_21455 [Bacteroidales bacterium]|nr:hypothetical protein [Bacteroidales bacterium]